MAVNETRILMFGFVGKDPIRIGQPGSTPICSFRLGSTPGYFDGGKGTWVRRPTTWVTVKAFRTLAMNLLQSLHRGDPVMVTGSLVTEEWTTKDGQSHSSLVLEADGVGHDLNLGQGTFARVRHEDTNIQGSREPRKGQISSDVQGLHCGPEGEEDQNTDGGNKDGGKDQIELDEQKASLQSEDAF